MPMRDVRIMRQTGTNQFMDKQLARIKETLVKIDDLVLETGYCVEQIRRDNWLKDVTNHYNQKEDNGMTEFQTSCVDILDYFKEGITYNEWKGRINTINVHNKKFEDIVIYVLTRRVINCKNGLFYWNKEYVDGYITRYGRSPNFCIEHLRFFDEWVNPRTMEETGQ